MSTAELIATLVLPKLPKIGCRTARRLIRHFGSAEAVFQRIGRENTKPFNRIAALFIRPEAKLVREAVKMWPNCSVGKREKNTTPAKVFL